MSEWDFQKSRFEQKNMSENLQAVEQQKKMDANKFEKAFGYDFVSMDLQNRAAQLSADQIFGEQLENRAQIPKDRLKDKIAEKYHEAFGNKTVWKMTKGKRADHAKNKLSLQDHMREEYEALIRRRNEEAEDRMNYISMDMADHLAENYITNDEKAALREWIIGIDAKNVSYNEIEGKFEAEDDPETVSYAKRLTSDNKEERIKAYKDIFKVASAIDLDQLGYTSDRDFASNFAKKYDVICKVAALQVFIDKFKEDGGTTINDHICVADLEARAELAKQYKEEYEMRMQLISSPYYALLSTDDVQDFMSKKDKGRNVDAASPEFTRYINLYRKLNESAVGKNVNAGFHLDELKDQKREAYAQEYIDRVNEAIPDADQLTDMSANALVSALNISKEVPVAADDFAFMLNTPVELKMDNYNPAQIKRIEENITEAVRNKSFGGVALKQEMHEEVDRSYRTVSQTKKDYYIALKKLEYVKSLKTGLGCDTNTPGFKNLPQAKVIKALKRGGDEAIEALQKNADSLAAAYRKNLVNLAITLDDQGLKAYSGEQEDLIVKRDYDAEPEMENDSRVALFREALMTRSQADMDKVKAMPYSTKKLGQRMFHEIFKERHENNNPELPEEGEVLPMEAEDKKEINWMLHQLVMNEDLDADGIDKLQELWEKRIAYKQGEGEPVSESVQNTVSNFFFSWKETLEGVEQKKMDIKTSIVMNRQQSTVLKLQKQGGVDVIKELQQKREAQKKQDYEARKGNVARVNRDMAHWDEKIKGSYHHVLDLETETTYQAVMHPVEANERIRQRIINDEMRQERRNLYMELTDEQRKALRAKKQYVLRKEEPQQRHVRNTYGKLYRNSIRDVEAVLRKMNPKAYEEVDRKRRSDDPKDRVVDLYHSEGTRLLEEEGHEVLEIDIGGSSYREFSHAQNGFLGYSEGDEYELHKQYGEQYYSPRNGKIMKFIRSKTTYGESDIATGRRKTRFTIAGPSPTTGGITNFGDYSIGHTTENIKEIGSSYLEAIFKKWDAEMKEYDKKKTGPDPSMNFPMVDVMLRGHSRGGVGSSMGEMKLKHWLHTNYPKYENKVKFHITQYDAVPGGPSDWGGYEKIDHTGKGHTTYANKAADTAARKIKDTEYLPVGAEAETTAIYSMNTQYKDNFAAQEIRHAKRLIFTPFNHAVGLDVESTDNSQMDQEGEKLHAMTFYDTTTNKAYRQSGLDHLGDGVYVMDEKHNLVKLNSVDEYVKIIQLTVPQSELKEQATRHKAMLHAVASKFDMEDEAADNIWKENLKSEEVKEAEENWSVYDAENKVRSVSTETEDKKKFVKGMKAALENRRHIFNSYIDKKVEVENRKNFLKACVDASYKTDYVGYGLQKADKSADAIAEMQAAVEEYRKLKGTVNLDDLSDDELEIVNSAETAVKLYDVTLQRIVDEYEEINEEDVAREHKKNIIRNNNKPDLEVIKEEAEEKEEEKSLFGSAVIVEDEKKEVKKEDKKEDKKIDDDEEDDDDFEVVDSKNIYY